MHNIWSDDFRAERRRDADEEDGSFGHCGSDEVQGRTKNDDPEDIIRQTWRMVRIVQ